MEPAMSSPQRIHASGYEVLPTASHGAPTDRSRLRKRWITYLLASVGLVGFVFLLALCIHSTAKNGKPMRANIEKGLTQLSETSDAMFEGVWDKGEIDGDVLIWPSGAKAKIKVVSPTELTVTYRGKTYQGAMHADMKLHWSDGDIWSRIKKEKSKESEEEKEEKEEGEKENEEEEEEGEEEEEEKKKKKNKKKKKKEAAKNTKAATTTTEADITTTEKREEKKQSNTCKCSHGDAARGSACTKDGENICMSCDSGYFLENGSCEACEKDCEKCSSSDVCAKCGNGKYLHDEDCVTSCPAGYVSDSAGKTCKANKCSCPHGEGVEGKDCEKDGAVFCKNCDSGYIFHSSSCEAEASIKQQVKKLEDERDAAIVKKEYHLVASLIKKIKALKKVLQEAEELKKAIEQAKEK